jgi:hypothetical protein
LSMVVAFAAYTFYTIAGDEIRANRTTKHIGKRLLTETQPNGEKALSARTTKPTPKPKASPTKARAVKIEKPAGRPATVTSDTILAYLSANGPVTITKLSKELQMDKATVMLAAEKLINGKLAFSIKRGGYPAIALSES